MGKSNKQAEKAKRVRRQRLQTGMAAAGLVTGAIQAAPVVVHAATHIFDSSTDPKSEGDGWVEDASLAYGYRWRTAAGNSELTFSWNPQRRQWTLGASDPAAYRPVAAGHRQERPLLLPTLTELASAYGLDGNTPVLFEFLAPDSAEPAVRAVLGRTLPGSVDRIAQAWMGHHDEGDIWERKTQFRSAMGPL